MAPKTPGGLLDEIRGDRPGSPNPFNGQAELDTSCYSCRWVNNQGDVIYTDENSFDPNTIEKYKTREWKRTPIRKR